MLDHPPFVSARDRIRPDELLSQANDADLRALRDLDLRRGAERELDAAPADVDDGGATVRDVDAVDGGPVDQAGLLGARDHLDPHPSALPDRGQKLAAVVGLAHRAGGRGNDLVDIVRLGEPLEFRERLQRGRHGSLGERAPSETARTETHHLLLAVDDLEGEVGTHLHDDHVDRVGADVDGGDAHASFDQKAHTGVMPERGVAGSSCIILER